MGKKRIALLLSFLGLVAAAGGIGWYAGSHIESPAEAAARTAPPKPSPILVPVETRTLSSNIITRGTARFGLPQPLSVVPSGLKKGPGLIATLPRRNSQLEEGAVVLTASGRPVFLLQGETPAYRDLVPGISGDDVLQLEKSLERLGFDPGTVDRQYDRQTSTAVSHWYKSMGWEPFGPTLDQVSAVRQLERDYHEALKSKLAAESTLASAELEVDAANATAESLVRAAEAELAARQAERRQLTSVSRKGSALSVDTARAQAEYALQAAKADVSAKIKERAQVVIDPRQPKTARDLVEANLDLAKAALERTRLESEVAIQQAAKESKHRPSALQSADAAIKSAKAALASARLERQRAIRAAQDGIKLARFDAKLTAERVDQLATDLSQARGKLGMQVPVDEIVFLPSLPVRVEEVASAIGDSAAGTIVKVTDNQVSVDGALSLDTAPLVKPGMRVQIDEQALGIRATGTVKRVADTPGTHGVDGFHIYFEVAVDETPTRLEGFSLRLTIPIESTEGEVTAVPLSAVALAADGRSRVQREREDGSLEYVTVQPGMSADGYVQVTAVDDELAPGDLVVVGYETPE